MTEFDNDFAAKINDSSTLDMLGQLTDFRPPAIQEAVFKQLFLPLFLDSDGKRDMDAWIAAAGSPFNPVNVYRGQEFLFQVPPFLSPSDKYLDGMKDVAISEQLAVTEKKFESFPKFGEIHFREWFIDRVRGKHYDIELTRRWNKIFEFYGLPVIPLPAELSPAQQRAVEVTGFDFDDLE